MSTSDSRLVERIDDVEAFLRRPGRYHTTTGHQAYGVLIALGWHPYVKLGEELFFPEGTLLFADVDPVPPSLTSNPLESYSLEPNAVEKIAWGTEPDYFERRLRDYDHWEIAFWRELVQNARDAGASRLDMECVEDTYEDPETGDRVACMRVSARDNGRGMNEDTLMRAFFRRGGSLKEAGSVGGFGDAKNLILTPWLGYRVRTQDVVATGRHETIFAPILTGQPYLHGTEITVWMPLTKTTTPEHAQLLVEQSSLSLAFTINGRRIDQKLPQGNLVLQKPIVVRQGYTDERTVGEMLIYHSPRARRHGIYVRSHGLYMYQFHGFIGEFKGVVTAEVNAPPVQVFTTKRDQLSFESTARADFNAFVQKLGADPKQLLKKVRDKKEVIFRGTGSIDVRQGRVAEIAAKIAEKVDMSRTQRQGKGGVSTVKLDKGQVEAAIEIMTALRADIAGSGEGPSVEPLASTFGTMVAQGEFADVEQVVGAMQLAMWKPDFYLYQNISPWKLPKALHPETMALKYHQLLQVWTEVCKFIMAQLGMFKPFGVGWVFDTDYDPQKGESVIAALYRQYEGHDWLLINPVDIERHGYDENVRFELTGDAFKLGDPASMERLVSYAVHEITHMQGYVSHTDAYASALTSNIRAIFRLAPVLKKIVKEARAAVREERPASRQPKHESRGERVEPTEWAELVPTSSVGDPWFWALWGLFAAADQGLARTLMYDEIGYYLGKPLEFQEAMIRLGENMGSLAADGPREFDSNVYRALRRILADPQSYRRGGHTSDRGTSRVPLISDEPAGQERFPALLRRGGEEAWYAATTSFDESPRLTEETRQTLVHAMDAVYDLSGIGAFAKMMWLR